MAGTPDKQWLRGSAIVICGGLHGSPSMKPHVYWRATAGREEAEDRADTEDKKAGKKGCRVAPRFAPPPHHGIRRVVPGGHRPVRPLLTHKQAWDPGVRLASLTLCTCKLPDKATVLHSAD